MDTQYLKNILKYGISVLLSIILISYILYHMSGGFQEEIETEAAVLTTKEETLTINTIIMREEKVLFSPINGMTNYLFGDGEKIAANTAVADIYLSSGSSDSAEIRKKIIELDKKIKILEDSNMSDAEKRSDTASTDKLIWNDIYSFEKAAGDGNVPIASYLSDRILVQLNRRKIIVKSTVNYDKEIEELKKEKELLSSKLSSAETTVFTDCAGYFYAAADGYENIFSTDDIYSLSYSRFREMCSKPAEDFLGTGKGFPIGKLVTDYVWYTACEVSNNELHNFDTGEYYDIKFPHNNGATVRMSLYRIISEVGSDTAVLLFRANVVPANFSYLRNQTVQVVKKAYSGYRVPVSAVRVENGVKGVYILRGSKVEFRRIETLFEYDGYFVVKKRDENAKDKADWLALNDFVIVKGKNLYDGKIVS